MAAREPDHLVRERRPDDQDVVAIRQPPVDLDRHLEGVAALAQAVHLLGRKGAEGGQLGGLIPRVVIDADFSKPLAAVLLGEFDEFQDPLLAHRRMCAEGDEEVDLGGARLQEQAAQRPEHQAHGGRARRVGDEHQDALAAKVQPLDGLLAEVAHFHVRKDAFFMAAADDHGVCLYQPGGVSSTTGKLSAPSACSNSTSDGSMRTVVAGNSRRTG